MQTDEERPQERLDGVATPLPVTLIGSRLCGHCGRRIEHPRDTQKWCSPRCRYAGWKGGREAAARARYRARDDELLEHAEALVRLLKKPVA